MRNFRNAGDIFTIRTTALFLLIAVFCVFTGTAGAHLLVGTEAPALSLKGIDGNEVNLSRYSQSRAIVIIFWSTWSSNSPKALKRFEEFHRKYKDKGIQVIGVNADKQLIKAEDTEEIKRVMKELDITFPVAIDNGLKTFHDYETISLPTTVVVSGGKITYALPGLPVVGTEDLFDHLLALAGEKTAKKTKPQYEPVHAAIADVNLAKQFVKKRKYEAAYQLLKKALKKDRNYMLAYIELGELYMREGKDTEAEETFRNALSINPEAVAVMSELGYLLAKTGRQKEAVEVLAGAIQKDEAYTPAHYYYAYALSKGKGLKEAFVAFSKAVSLNPFDPMIYSLRGEVYERNKMSAEASSDYKKARELKTEEKHQGIPQK